MIKKRNSKSTPMSIRLREVEEDESEYQDLKLEQASIKPMQEVIPQPEETKEVKERLPRSVRKESFSSSTKNKSKPKFNSIEFVEDEQSLFSDFKQTIQQTPMELQTDYQELSDEEMPEAPSIEQSNSSSTIIPDSFTIQEAKERRKRLREQREQEDENQTSAENYIPLMSGNKNKNSKTSNRLVREDFENDEDLDEDEINDGKKSSIQFGKIENEFEKFKKQYREQIEVEEEDEPFHVKPREIISIDEEEEEEKQPISQTQFMPPITEEEDDWETSQLIKSGILKPKPVLSSSEEGLFGTKTATQTKPVSYGTYSVQEGKHTVLSIEEVEFKLKETLDQLTNKFSSQQSQIVKMNTELEQATAQVALYSTELQTISETKKYFSEMTDFVNELCEQFEDKELLIIEDEKKLFTIRKEFYEPIYEQLLRHCNDDSFFTTDHNTMDQIVVEKIQSKLDTLHSRLFSLNKEVNRIFFSVQEECKQISLLKDRFENWKWTYPHIYKATYCSLSLLKLFSILVRYDLLLNYCDPMNQNAAIDRFDWWQSLVTFGINESNLENSEEEDEDSNIMPSIVKSIILPHVKQAIANCYIPFSRTYTQKVIEMIEEASTYVEVNSESFASVITIFLERCKQVYRDLVERFEENHRLMNPIQYVHFYAAIIESLGMVSKHLSSKLNIHQFQDLFTALAVETIWKKSLSQLISPTTTQFVQPYINPVSCPIEWLRSFSSP